MQSADCTQVLAFWLLLLASDHVACWGLAVECRRAMYVQSRGKVKHCGVYPDSPAPPLSREYPTRYEHT